MGAWGSGPFDNDDAADWSAELDEADDALAFVGETLATVERSDGYVESPDACCAIAAAAWLASRLPGSPVEASAYAPEAPPPGDRAAIGPLADRAAAVLDRVNGAESEWRELWDEAADEQAPATVRALAAFLRG
jgi:hypothetical protein